VDIILKFNDWPGISKIVRPLIAGVTLTVSTGRTAVNRQPKHHLAARLSGSPFSVTLIRSGSGISLS
jgi:hypothetical protein